MIVELSLLVAVVFVLYYVLTKRPDGLPPGDWGYPIVGNIPMNRKQLKEMIEEQRSKYGDIFRCFGRGPEIPVLSARKYLIRSQVELSSNKEVPNAVMGCPREMAMMEHGGGGRASRKDGEGLASQESCSLDSDDDGVCAAAASVVRTAASTRPSDVTSRRRGALPPVPDLLPLPNVGNCLGVPRLEVPPVSVPAIETLNGGSATAMPPRLQDGLGFLGAAGGQGATTPLRRR